MDVARYMERIGVSQPVELTKEALDQLVYQHQISIPFEDIDIYDLHLPVPLDLDALEQKVLVRGRGGYCFELNALFCQLLKELGFQVWGIAARVVDAGVLSPTPDHRANVVQLDGKNYLVDVGMGGPMAPFAIPLDGQKHEQRGETYWSESSEEQGWFWLKRYRGKGILADEQAERVESPVVLYSLEEIQPEECQRISDSLSQGEDAAFRYERLVNLRTENGYRAITNDTFVVREGDQRHTEPVADNLFTLLRQHFNIVVDAPAGA